MHRKETSMSLPKVLTKLIMKGSTKKKYSPSKNITANKLIDSVDIKNLNEKEFKKLYPALQKEFDEVQILGDISDDKKYVRKKIDFVNALYNKKYKNSFEEQEIIEEYGEEGFEEFLNSFVDNYDAALDRFLESKGLNEKFLKTKDGIISFYELAKKGLFTNYGNAALKQKYPELNNPKNIITLKDVPDRLIKEEPSVLKLVPKSVNDRKRGGSVVERNPYNYKPKTI